METRTFSICALLMSVISVALCVVCLWLQLFVRRPSDATQPQAETKTARAIQEHESNLDDLDFRLSSCESDIKYLRSWTDGLDDERMATIEKDFQRLKDGGEFSFLPMQSGRWGFFPSNVGPMAVMLNSIERVGSGIRISIDIGNCTAANISAFTLKFRHGPKEPPYPVTHPSDPSYNREKDRYRKRKAEWEKQLKVKTLVFEQWLVSNNWNTVKAYLAPCGMKDAQHIELLIKVDSIGLRRNIVLQR